MHRKMSIVGSLSLLAVGLALMVGVSHAQYPQPGPSILLESNSTTVPLDGNAELTIVVMEGDLPAANEAVDVTIVEEPEGSDSAVGSKSVTKLTNAQGILKTNLYVGTVPGILVIEAKSQTLGVISTVIVIVGDGQEPSPPQSGVNGITPPNTGSAGLAH